MGSGSVLASGSDLALAAPLSGFCTNGSPTYMYERGRDGVREERKGGRTGKGREGGMQDRKKAEREGGVREGERIGKKQRGGGGRKDRREGEREGGRKGR